MRKSGLVFLFILSLKISFSQLRSGIGFGVSPLKTIYLYDTPSACFGVNFKHQKWVVIPQIYYGQYFSTKSYHPNKGFRIEPSLYIPFSFGQENPKNYFYTGVDAFIRKVNYTAYAKGYFEEDTETYIYHVNKQSYALAGALGVYMETKFNLFFDIHFNLGVRYTQNSIKLEDHPVKDLDKVIGDSQSLNLILSDGTIWMPNYVIEFRIGYFFPFKRK